MNFPTFYLPIFLLPEPHFMNYLCSLSTPRSPPPLNSHNVLFPSPAPLKGSSGGSPGTGQCFLRGTSCWWPSSLHSNLLASFYKIYLSSLLIVLQMSLVFSPLTLFNWKPPLPSLLASVTSHFPDFPWTSLMTQSPSPFQVSKEKPTCSLAVFILIAQGALPSLYYLFSMCTCICFPATPPTPGPLKLE